MAIENERPARGNAGEGRRDSDRNTGRPNTDRDGKKVFNRRDKGDSGERRSFGGDRREGSNERRSFGGDRREGGERRPYNSDRREGSEKRSFGGDRREGGERRSFNNDRKPFGGDRREGDDRSSFGSRTEGGERRSFGNDRREGGERRSFGGDRREGGEKRSFGNDRREGGERRSFDGDRREGGEKRSFTPRREDGERKPFNSDRRDSGERRSFGGDRREETGERRSFNSDRNREGSERRSFNSDRNEGGGKRPYNSDRREGGEKRSFGGDRRESGERNSFNADRRDDRRSNDRPYNRENREGGERRSFGEKREFGDKKTFRPERRENKFSNSDRRSKDGADKPETPNYNLSRYNDNPRIKKTNIKQEDDGTLRLNRYIANAGVCSRREADVLIESGEIKVNGEVVTEMGYKVNPGDTVMYGKQVLSREKMVYVLLNKPKDFITTTDDPEGRKTVMSLVENASTERIFPVGRLDRNTTGLLLFTNDGEMAQKLTHPSNNVKKIYQVELDKPLTKDHFRQIAEGLELEDGKADVDDVALLGESNKFVGIEIHIGRNRIVRRIFEHLGYDVVSLDRVQYATLTKKDLPRSNWRYLTEKEVIRLKYFM
ncbi:pseudouridine synthase [Pontibacter arcticus]|uniref:Pseudouridine synthase n=1 Tax=Pontibacter arcticus TaxID=2080288 RepID=A0A364RIU9_9BACT|nr:pseudouridine synthase [Pontibacter arcticus]RAU84227.1 pseudouridylate synthase [Pontibacter arcticus]